jgi:N-acetylglutamate synthase-like GNAT family acetyltransferase
MIEITPGTMKLEDIFFYFLLRHEKENIGVLLVTTHPDDENGGQVHLEIAPAWRGRWLTRSIRESILEALTETAKNHDLKILYSTALTDVSPRLLTFFGFADYHTEEPYKYYFLEV